MLKTKAARIILPLFPALVLVALFAINSALSTSSVPAVKDGILDLSGSNSRAIAVFNLAGRWEFYWDKLLEDGEIESGREKPILTDAPDIWNGLEINGKALPGFGKATYRAQVINAPVGKKLAVRIQNQASAYRLYIDEQLVAKNGNFGDGSDAPVREYRPQFAGFIPEKDTFDVILQISNDAYAVGGMWEPIMFGSYESMSTVNDAVKIVDYVSIGALVAMCLFFAVLFVIVRREKESLVLCGIGLAVVLRFMIFGDSIITHILPNMPIAGFGWIDYLSQVWIQFFLLYFIYLVYTSIVGRLPVRLLAIYTVCVSIFILAFPFEIVVSTYQVMSAILLLIVAGVVVYAARAAKEGRTGARSLLAAMAFILFSILYEFFAEDLSLTYFYINGWALDFTILFIVQSTIVARRYQEAQQLEMGLLKSQIRPHFVHNALSTIISISRKDSERSRDLLVDFSSYLRGCYDYEGDDLISIEQELDFVRAYVALEQARFGDKLKVKYEIEVDDALVPSLILQPLVENAFVHGLREKEDGGTVVVYVVRGKGNIAKIGVRDDGVGLAATQEKPSKRQGIGIANIDRRLARIFKTQLVFKTPAEGGCEVYMEIPYQKAGDDDESCAGR